MTRDEMIESGKNVGATHAVIRTPHDGRHPQVVYVLPGDDHRNVVADCLDAESFIEVITLKDQK